MTGSNLAAIVIPIVVMLGLGVWIAPRRPHQAGTMRRVPISVAPR